MTGFMMKHFKVYPATLDMNNLHERQQAFLIYLFAVIPSQENWTLDVSFQRESAAIEEMTLKDVKLSAADRDLLRLQGLDIQEAKKKRLEEMKKAKLEELRKEYGFESEDWKKKKPQSGMANDGVYTELQKRIDKQKDMFDKLSGKGIVDGL